MTDERQREADPVGYACAVRIYPRPRWPAWQRAWAWAYSTACMVAFGWPVAAYIARQVSAP